MGSAGAKGSVRILSTGPLEILSWWLEQCL